MTRNISPTSIPAVFPAGMRLTTRRSCITPLSSKRFLIRDLRATLPRSSFRSASRSSLWRRDSASAMSSYCCLFGPAACFRNDLKIIGVNYLTRVINGYHADRHLVLTQQGNQVPDPFHGLLCIITKPADGIFGPFSGSPFLLERRARQVRVKPVINLLKPFGFVSV